MNKLRLVAMFASLLVLASCAKMCGTSRQDMTPEQVVEKYLEISLNMKDPTDKQKLLELSTGNLKSAIASASDDMIKEAFVDKNYILENYSVVERRDRTPRETEITFSLTYADLGKSKQHSKTDAPKVTTENTVSVVKEKKIWLMKDVIGKKTSIDFPIVKGEIIKPEGTPPPAEAPTE